MMNPFGPQGPQAVTSLPAGTDMVRYGLAAATWFKDCSAPHANDATVLDAATLNMIIGNLWEVLQVSGIAPVNRGDMTLLRRAIAAILHNEIGVTDAVIDGGTF